MSSGLFGSLAANAADESSLLAATAFAAATMSPFCNPVPVRSGMVVCSLVTIATAA
jgi:hypothetical protein